MLKISNEKVLVPAMRSAFGFATAGKSQPFKLNWKGEKKRKNIQNHEFTEIPGFHKNNFSDYSVGCLRISN